MGRRWKKRKFRLRKGRAAGWLAALAFVVSSAVFVILAGSSAFVPGTCAAYAGLALLLLCVGVAALVQSGKRSLRAAGMVLCVCFTVAPAVGSSYLLKVDQVIRDVGRDTVRTDDGGLYQYEAGTEQPPEEDVMQEPFHIYISGMDRSGSVAETEENSRSDVNIIATVNPGTKEILLTSTPRDYYVVIPGVSGGQKDKLTHAGIYGVDASIAALEQLYGIDIRYYLKVNFTSLVEIVDALGGVEVYSEYAFDTALDGESYHFQEGMNNLDGQQALAFARERKSFQEGDNQRGENQRALLAALIEKAASPMVLLGANRLLEEVGDMVETNMTAEEIRAFIRMQMEDRAEWGIESVAATGSDAREACYSTGSRLLYVMLPDEAVVEELSMKMEQTAGQEGQERPGTP